MFKAYRLIFLRDVNSLDGETRREMRSNYARFVYANKAALGRARYEYVMGRCASVVDRLREIPLTAPHEIEPGTSTSYGGSSLGKALKILERDHNDGRRLYNSAFTLGVFWRLQK